jgi:hypothetical protein
VRRGSTSRETVNVFIKVSGYSAPSEDRWINTDQIVDIHYNGQEKRYDIAMVSERYIQVLEPEAMQAIDKLLGRDVSLPPESDETYI